MRTWMKTLLPMLVVGAAITVACGGGGSNTVTIPGGGQVSVSDKLPDSFPKDYPVYGGATVKGSLSGTTNGITGTTVTWETGDSLSKVTDFYTNAFKSGAWTTNTSGQVNNSSYWSGESSDGKKSHYILVSSQSGKTSIIVTVGDKPVDSSSSSGDSSKTSTSSSNSSKTATPSSDSSSGASSSPSSATLPAEVTLAKNFPADRVPLPSGARVTSSSSFGSGGSTTYSIELYVKDTPSNISDYFSGELPKHGWASAFTSNSNGQYLLTFANEGADATSTEGVTVSASDSDVSGYAKVDLIVTSTGT
jgi:hypothetical protein